MMNLNNQFPENFYSWIKINLAIKEKKGWW
jgi:hypothetical protein